MVRRAEEFGGESRNGGGTALLDEAQREAAEAESEFASMSAEERASASNGVATQPDDPAQYQPPQPTPDQVKAAEQVYAELRDRVASYGPNQTVLALVQVIDVIPPFITPDQWPGASDEEYRESGTIKEIASFLLRGCPKLELEPKGLVCLWRNKEKWTRNGVTVRGATKAFDTRTSFMLKGKVASIEINFHHWKTLNPLQKTLAVYHELRGLEGDGGSIAPDFSGWLDELDVFGPRVFREMALLAGAIDRGRGRAQELPANFQLSLLEAAED